MMKCDRCGGTICQRTAVSARLRHYETGEWVVIVRMCQSCATSWFGWRDESLPSFVEPILSTDTQFTDWLQLTPR